LVNLVELYVFQNQISDISALIALPWSGGGDCLTIQDNLLDSGDCANINTLKGKVNTLVYSPQNTGSLTCP